MCDEDEVQVMVMMIMTCVDDHEQCDDHKLYNFAGYILVWWSAVYNSMQSCYCEGWNTSIDSYEMLVRVRNCHLQHTNCMQCCSQPTTASSVTCTLTEYYRNDNGIILITGLIPRDQCLVRSLEITALAVFSFKT